MSTSLDEAADAATASTRAAARKACRKRKRTMSTVCHELLAMRSATPIVACLQMCVMCAKRSKMGQEVSKASKLRISLGRLPVVQTAFTPSCTLQLEQHIQ